MKKLFYCLGAGIASLTAVGIIFTNKVIYIKKKSDESILQREIAEGRFSIEELENLNKESLMIPSKFGYSIHGWFVRSTANKKFMIISHGVTMNKINSIKYMKLFLNRGWNVIVYDQRRHGESGGNTTSYGHYEKFDLQSVVAWVKEHHGEDSIIGIHGESMGAVTTLLYAGMVEDGADFYIVDCPFSDFKEQLRYLLKKDFKLPSFPVLPIANNLLKLRDGYRMEDVSPISVITNIKSPVLFIHSAKDDYILPEMTKQLYQQKDGPKKLFIAKNGRHAYSYGDNQKEYEEAIDQFLEEMLKG
ncbi:alpha/beta hydrolase [Bacillus sp. PS06]|uniref:alpha/beta hydrolase n=1 Tax=Bacillus sp. PS06 TaxID=2764176 RepID=UPI0017814419|nr:alpha/beta hydrolase [Bacillus sp. PS06]MBD8070345.1 alpha/beta hydrolase [Bacillus sp. PS06]